MYPDGYDLAQIRITGQYSYHRDTQRDIQFLTDIREIDLGRRVWHGEESKFIGSVGNIYGFML